ncbi:hypothetical protein Cgig2_030903 [Carnegiea gigantea]|uniref:Uncharacterized protein n=1 Tax=Carnegiea gigantea TaxID=171969 RepID=A0A9Q1GL70_9CARY|nr:hypothetical protein Cgig2_020792 [Carnegiea gigantea]KAJ8421302.1 hypothetical protein Cgig2_030903 [Carnegiea gigantea]
MEATIVDDWAIVVREVFGYICLGVYLKRGGNGVLTYHGGSSDCILMRQNMGIADVVKVAEEIMGKGFRECRLWYNTKFNQNIIMPLQGDVDVVKLVKGNDEFSCMYVTKMEGLIRISVARIEYNDVEIKYARLSMKTVGSDRWMVRKRRRRTSYSRNKCKFRTNGEGSDIGDMLMNNVHHLATHDMASMDSRTGHVIGGEALDDDYH